MALLPALLATARDAELVARDNSLAATAGDVAHEEG